MTERNCPKNGENDGKMTISGEKTTRHANTNRYDAMQALISVNMPGSYHE